MKIKFISEEGIIAIKSNKSSVYKDILEKRKKTLPELLRDENIIKETPFEIADFSLDMSHAKPPLTDLENIKRVYKHMMRLTESQASDERIWMAYTLSEFLDYMKYRWKTASVNDMENRYFFNYSSQRSLIRNGIARLWWLGKYTYAAERSDPYELTAFICKDQDYIDSIFGRNFSNNKIISKAIIVALIDAEKAGMYIDRDLVRNLVKYINLLGGTYILDCLSYNEIYEKIQIKLRF